MLDDNSRNPDHVRVQAVLGIFIILTLALLFGGGLDEIINWIRGVNQPLF